MLDVGESTGGALSLVYVEKFIFWAKTSARASGTVCSKLKPHFPLYSLAYDNARTCYPNIHLNSVNCCYSRLAEEEMTCIVGKGQGKNVPSWKTLQPEY